MRPFGAPTISANSFRRRFLPFSLRPDPFQQHRRRFVVAAFAACEFGFGRRQFAAVRLGQYRPRQLVGPRRCRRHPLLDGVGRPEQGLDAVDEFVLSGYCRNPNCDEWVMLSNDQMNSTRLRISSTS
jgi:hypothetical protein